MGGGRRRESPSCRTYGFPVFSVFWVNGNEAQQAAAGGEGGVGEKSTATVEDDSGGMLLALGGGGGEGRSGIPNALLLVCFDPASRSLSEKPVHRLATDQDVPYRMVQHPMGEGLLCSFPKGCRWYEWDAPHGSQDHKLTLKLPEKTLTQFNDVGLQLALAFNLDGSLLATGGEDGHMKIFKWPAMEIVLEHRDGNQSVKDLDFSSNSKFLASVANNGLCRIWDPNSTEIIANLSRENGEKFGHCRFSMTTNDDIVLYTTASEGKFGKVLSWSTTSWNRLKSKIVAKDPISAFSVSNNGKLLAIGTSEGDVIILDSSDMQIHTTVKQAHLGRNRPLPSLIISASYLLFLARGSIAMELMLFLILSSLLLTARVASDPVLDVDGKELRRGQLYYAGSVMRPGGGLTLASVNGSSCPLNVAQARLIDFKGKPLAFFPEDPDQDIVSQGTTLYVMFPEPTQCSESTVWKLESGVVTTGGTKSRSVGPRSSRFAIHPVTESGYQFVSCPCSIGVPWASCRMGCSDPLGGVQEVEGGKVLLGSGGTPHTVIFSKVEEGHTTI